MAYNIGGMLAQAGTNVGQSMGGGLANLGAGIGGMLTRRREKQAQQNAQQQFQQILGAYQDKPEQLKEQAVLMQTSPDANLQRMGDLLMQQATRVETAQAAKRTEQYVSSLGEQAVAEYQAGVPLGDVRKGYFTRQEQQSLQTIAENAGLDIDPELAGQLTGKQIYDLMESKKEAEGEKAWAKWNNENPNGITPENRSQAMQAALKALGAKAPETIARMEADQLEARAKKAQQRVKKVNITLNDSSISSGVFGYGPKIITKELPVGDDGNFTKEALEFLRKNAVHAISTDGTASFNLDDVPISDSPAYRPEGESQQGEQATLGQLIGPQGLDSALNQIGDFK